jgi:hypothetical protein
MGENIKKSYFWFGIDDMWNDTANDRRQMKLVAKAAPSLRGLRSSTQ